MLSSQFRKASTRRGYMQLGMLRVLPFVIGILLLERRAEACSCASPMAHIDWPEAGKLAPRDTPIVVNSFDGGFGSSASIELLSNSVPVAFAEKRRLRTEGDCSGEWVFLQPALLAANTTYTVRVTFGGSWASGTSVDINFETNADFSGPVSVQVPDLDVLFVRGEDDYEPDYFYQLFTDYRGSGLIWLAYETEHGWRSSPLYRPPPVPSVPQIEPDWGRLLGKVDCGRYEVVNLAGDTVLTEEVCEPQRCLWASAATGNSCSRYRGFSWDQWSSVPDGCTQSNGDAGVVSASTDDKVRAGGCQVASEQGAGAPSWFYGATLSLGMGLWRRRRRPESSA